MIRYKCPKCGEGLAVDDGKAGRPYVCPQCDHQTIVPTPPRAHVETKAASPALPLDKQLAARQGGREQHAVALEPDSVVTPTASQTGRLPRALAVGAAVVILPVVGLGLFFAGRSTAPTAPPSKDKPRAAQSVPAPPPIPIPQPASPQQYPVLPPNNTFQTRQEQPAVSRGASPQARQALDAAHDLQSSVKVGLNFEEYGRQLIRASQTIDRCKREASAEDLAAPYWKSIDGAMRCYEAGAGTWEKNIRYGNNSFEGILQQRWALASEYLVDADAAIGAR